MSNVVREVLRKDPLCGHVFVFINRRKTMVKLLLWTRGGFTILHKRLELGTFANVFTANEERPHVEIDIRELSMLLEGVDLSRSHVEAMGACSTHRSGKQQSNGIGQKGVACSHATCDEELWEMP